MIFTIILDVCTFPSFIKKKLKSVYKFEKPKKVYIWNPGKFYEKKDENGREIKKVLKLFTYKKQPV